MLVVATAASAFRAAFSFFSGHSMLMQMVQGFPRPLRMRTMGLPQVLHVWSVAWTKPRWGKG